MESKFYPKLSHAEAQDVLRSETAGEKFHLATRALGRKLSRLDDDTAEAIAAVQGDTTSATAHSDLSDQIRFARKECDSAADYFSATMDQFKPPDGVRTRAQAAVLDQQQIRNFEIYLEADVLKVKFKKFLSGAIAENRRIQDEFELHKSKCKAETDLKMRIESQGVKSHEALRPKDRGDLGLSVVELERWSVEATNWCNSSHFEYESKAVQLQYMETILTEQMRNILSLDDKTFLECIAAVKATHSKMNSKFSRRVAFLETKKKSSEDWLEYATMLYNNGRLADVNTMSYDNLVIIKLTSEMPLELRQKIFTLEIGVDQMTWEKFVLALTNLVAIEKVTKCKQLAKIGNISTKSGGKKEYPDASSLPDLVRKLGCMRCGLAHVISDCTVPKTVICSHCKKPGHQVQACFSKIRSELPPGHSALAVAANVPALPAPGQEAGAGCTGVSGTPALAPRPAIPPVPDMGSLRLVDVTSLSDLQREALVGSNVVRPSTPHPGGK